MSAAVRMSELGLPVWMAAPRQLLTDMVALPDSLQQLGKVLTDAGYVDRAGPESKHGRWMNAATGDRIMAPRNRGAGDDIYLLQQAWAAVLEQFCRVTVMRNPATGEVLVMRSPDLGAADVKDLLGLAAAS